MPYCKVSATPSQFVPDWFSSTAQPCSRAASPSAAGSTKPVRGLPQRRRGDIADAYRAVPGTGAAQRDMAHALLRFPAERVQCLSDTRTQCRIGDLDAVGILQYELPHAVRTEQGDAGPLHRRRRLTLWRRQRFGDALGMDQPPGHRTRALHRDLDALQAVQVVDRRAQRLGSERHIAEACAGVVAAWQFNGADAAGAVEHHQRGQHVIHLIERHIEAERGRSIHLGLVFEVADAGGRQHHPLEAEIRGDGRGRAEQQKCQCQPSHRVPPLCFLDPCSRAADNNPRRVGG